MRVLVTGGCGFIGSALCKRLVRNGHAVLNLDLLTYAADPRTVAAIADDPLYTFVHGDVRDTELFGELLDKHSAQAVVHLAAESHVDRSIDGPKNFLETNVMGTYSVLQAVRGYLDRVGGELRQGFRLLHVSTDEVFGDLSADEPAFKEDSPYSPSSPYSASKAASDHLVRAWRRTLGVPAVVTNCSNNYGPYQFPEKLIPLMIVTALAGRKLPVYGDGRNVRDWLHVEDHADALETVLMHAEPGDSFNIGGNCERRNIDVVHAICDALDQMAPRNSGTYRDLISFVSDRPGHDRRYAIDGSHIARTLGWRPARQFEQGLEETVRWYLANENWWRPHLEGKNA